MSEIKGNILYFQSGGPTSVINSTFTGLFEEYLKHDHKDSKFYVSHYGISGLLNDNMEIFDENNKPNKLDYRPGSYFGSVRMKLPKDKNDPIAQKVINQIKKYNIHYVFPNGGNDSMDTCLRITQYFKSDPYECYIIGLPKTVDNDLGATDHTPGFGSAAKYVINTVLVTKIDDLSYEKGRVNIIEVMGRDNGSLTASSIVASLKGYGPDFIYVPEVAFDVEKFVKDVGEFYEKNKHCLVVISEGIRDKNGELISNVSAKDQFGNTQLGGVSHYLASLLEAKGIKNRSIELSVIQRASSFVPSLTDIKESKKCGAFGLKSALKGRSNKMVIMRRVSDSPYKIKLGLTNIKNVATTGVPMPSKYINEEGNNIRKEYIDYVLPLIKGEGDAFDELGLLNI